MGQSIKKVRSENTALQSSMNLTRPASIFKILVFFYDFKTELKNKVVFWVIFQVSLLFIKPKSTTINGRFKCILLHDDDDALGVCRFFKTFKFYEYLMNQTNIETGIL